jgi:hypothetical protein
VLYRPHFSLSWAIFIVVYTLQYQYFTIRFNIIVPSISYQCFPHFRSFHQGPVSMYFLRYIWYIPQISHPHLFDNRNNILWWVHSVKLHIVKYVPALPLILQVPPSPTYRSPYLLQLGVSFAAYHCIFLPNKVLSLTGHLCRCAAFCIYVSLLCYHNQLPV